MLWLVKWLLFRLIFASGVVKLTYMDKTWWNLTALNWHYESQVRWKRKYSTWRVECLRSWWFCLAGAQISGEAAKARERTVGFSSPVPRRSLLIR